MGEFPTSTATDTELIALGERLEGLLREYMDAWLEWAPRMRAAHAEAKDNTSALAVAVQRTGCDVAQQRMSELEHDMQPLAERIIAAPVTSLGGLRAKALVALWEALPATASHQGAETVLPFIVAPRLKSSTSRYPNGALGALCGCRY
jgi:hypothetical protein